MRTFLLSFLLCLLPSLVFATPSYRDAYGDSVGSGDLLVYVCLLVAAWVIAKLFNTSVEVVLCCAVGAFLVFIVLMFGATAIKAFLKYPLPIGCLFAFAYWLHVKDKTRNEVPKKPAPNFENVKEVMHQPQQEPVVYVKKPTVQKDSSDVINNISSKKQHPLNRVVLHSKDDE